MPGFRRYSGKTKFLWLPVTASTAIKEGAVVCFSSGKLIPMTNTSAASVGVGVIRHAIASTDSDYATARDVEVEVPIEKWVLWEGDVDTGHALVTTDYGTFMDLSTADDGDSVDASASSYDIVYVAGYISATKGLFVLNIGPECLGVHGD